MKTILFVVLIAIAAGTNVASGQVLLARANTCVVNCEPAVWEEVTSTIISPKSYNGQGVPSSVQCTTTITFRRKICANPEVGEARVVLFIDRICTDCPIGSISSLLEALILRAHEPDNPLGAFINTPGKTTTTDWLMRGCWSVGIYCPPDGSRNCLIPCDCDPNDGPSVEGNCRECCVVSATTKVNGACDVALESVQPAGTRSDCQGAYLNVAAFTETGCAIDEMAGCVQACPFPYQYIRE